MLRKSRVFISLTFLLVVMLSCEEDSLPKPSGFLRLDYKSTNYKKLEFDSAFSFEYSDQAKIVQKQDNWLDIVYPNLKATLVLTYSPINGNLRSLFSDAEKLTFKHMIKADDIQSMPYENKQTKVYGKMFEVYGNAATQIQFHVTDSTKNFITGALYFYAKPNYDSILPAVNFLRKDVVRIMETLEWKSQQ